MIIISSEPTLMGLILNSGLILGVPLLSCGFVLVLWFLPVAFVSLSTTELEEISAWRRLKIFSAGVWHNIVLSGIAYVLLVNLVPALFAPLFQVMIDVHYTILV